MWVGSIIEAFSSSLHLALAIAASPGAIIAMIILLMTRKALINSFSFLAGWFIGLLMVGIIFLHRPSLYDSTGEPSVILGWVRIIFGSSIFVTGLFMLKNVLKRSDRETPPGWADKMDSYGILHTLLIGFFFSAPNIKNASMVSTSAASIGNMGLSTYQEMSALILFCLVASLGVLVPPLIFLLFREKAKVIFGKMKIWLIRYRSLILFVICIGFGALFIYQGIRIVNSF